MQIQAHVNQAATKSVRDVAVQKKKNLQQKV